MQAGEIEKVNARLSKFTLPHLHELMDVLDLPRGEGTKVPSLPLHLPSFQTLQRPTSLFFQRLAWSPLECGLMIWQRPISGWDETQTRLLCVRLPPEMALLYS